MGKPDLTSDTRDYMLARVRLTLPRAGADGKARAGVARHARRLGTERATELRACLHEAAETGEGR